MRASASGAAPPPPGSAARSPTLPLTSRRRPRSPTPDHLFGCATSAADLAMNHDSAVPVAASARTHILQIVGNAIVGGMENYVVRLVERLPRDRFGVSVLAPFESPCTDQLRAAGADVFITQVTDEPSWQSIQLACSLIQSRHVDVVQSHLPNAHVLAALAGRLTGRPVLATVHGRAMT